MNGMTDRDIANRRLVKKLLWVIVGALLFTVALVPLYDVMCDITGFNGKTRGGAAQSSKSMKVDKTRWITVEFTSIVMPGLASDFAPIQSSMPVQPGQIETAIYLSKTVP